MYKSIGALALGLLVSASCLAQESLVGTYKLVSIKAEIDGKLRDDRTRPPHGYLIITPKYYAVFYTRQDRKFGSSDAEKAALWDSLTAFTGTYRIDGKKIVISPEVSYNEIFNGTQQTRDLEVHGRHLSLSSGPRPYGRDPSKKIVLRQEWEKIESVDCHPM
ncbi:MAG TPA: lipocalin-like domain-containing protein [Burkholderiales bacterium]|nr:lipocalin-like domain-containing protein [Burkholderiales bacterium]